MIIVLLPITLFDRKQAERIENCELSNENVKKIIEQSICMEIFDFMDLCNNQEFDIEQYWLTYIKKLN
jgi:hypothetical protein